MIDIHITNVANLLRKNSRCLNVAIVLLLLSPFVLNACGFLKSPTDKTSSKLYPTADITVKQIATSTPTTRQYANATHTEPAQQSTSEAEQATPQASPTNAINSVVDETEDYRAMGYPDQRKVVRDSQGNLYVAYRKQDTASKCYHIFVSKSTDTGASWQVLNAAPIEQVDDCTQRVPAIAVDDHDGLHVVWYGKDPENTGENQRQIKYAHSTDGGKTWSPWMNVATVAGYDKQSLWQEHPNIFIDSKMAIYIVWQGFDDAYRTASQTKFVKSMDDGKTWSQWKNVRPAMNQNQSRPTIVATKDGGQLYILAYGKGNNIQQIIWTTSTDGGDTWSPWKPVNASNNDQRYVSAVIDPHNQLYIVWRQADAAGAAQVYYSTYSGTTWSIATPISANPDAYQLFPSITATNDGTLWVVWTETTDPSNYPEDDPQVGQIKYAYKPVGNAWSAGTPLSPEGQTGIYASLGSSEFNNPKSPDVVWLDNSNTPKQIHYATITK